MYILRAFVFLAFLAQVLVAQQPKPILPDPNLTPGSSFDVTAQDVWTPGYAKKVRNVPEEMKREVYREYGITSHGPDEARVPPEQRTGLTECRQSGGAFGSRVKETEAHQSQVSEFSKVFLKSA